MCADYTGIEQTKYNVILFLDTDMVTDYQKWAFIETRRKNIYHALYVYYHI